MVVDIYFLNEWCYIENSSNYHEQSKAKDAVYMARYVANRTYLGNIKTASKW